MDEQPKMGKVTFENGKYFLQVGSKHEEMPVGLLADESQLKELVGQEVELIYSLPKPFVVGFIPKWRRPGGILCYIPAPEWWKIGSVVIDEHVRQRLVDTFVKENIITPEVAKTLSQGPARS